MLSLDVGKWIEFDGTVYRVHKLDNDEIHLANSSGEIKYVLTKTQFQIKWSEGVISYLSTGKKSFDLQSWEALTTKQKQVARDRAKFLKSYDALGHKPPKSMVKDMLAEVARDHDLKKPGLSTFYDWKAVWEYSGKSLAALAPRFNQRGNRKQLDVEVQSIIGDIIDDYMCNSRKPSVIEGYQELVRRIDRANNQLKAAPTGGEARVKKLVIPSYQTFSKKVRKSDQYELSLARDGHMTARLNFGIYGGGVKTRYPNERWEIDHSSADIFIADITGNVLGRLYLTAVIDHFTRMMAGYDISLDTPNSDSVARALRMAIAPKQNLIKNIIAQAEKENIQLTIHHEWPLYGVCDRLVCDNGKDFHSYALEEGCDDLGIDLMHLPRKAPYLKGIVERWFDTYQRDLAHRLNGTTLSNYRVLGEYKPEENAVYTWNEFNFMFLKFITDVYHAHSHRTLGMSPLDKLQESLDEQERG